MTWKTGQREAFAQELEAAFDREARGDSLAAFAHLERAHILGQRRPLAHARVHWRMLRIGWHRRDSREVFGQVIRAVAALTKSMIWVPVGNTGGANVHPLRSMPVPQDLRRFVD
jgi:hypothetical protein